MTTATVQSPPTELKDGQQISRDAFVRVTTANPDQYPHAERIDGRVVMNAASVRREGHGKPNSRVVTLLGIFESETVGTEVGDNSTARIDDANDPQPDAYLLILPDYGGQVRFTDDDYIAGAPELIIEIAGESLQKDLGRKKDLYESDGCQEYLVWSTGQRRFHCFRNGPDGFEDVAADDAIFRSRTFPGLWIDTAALLADDLPAAMATLREGLQSPAHAAFVTDLASRRT